MEALRVLGPKLPGVARRAIHGWLAGDGYGSFAAEGPPAPVFVTLRAKGGALRGCIGADGPTLRDVVSDTVRCAVLAATRDPRFDAVTSRELATLSIEVSVLGPEERVSGLSELDPREYAVVVRDGDGRAGMLLPGLEGVDRPSFQVELAREKGGIAPTAAVTLGRFRVHKWGDDGTFGRNAAAMDPFPASPAPALRIR
jgi:AMMECR1 domain-containing protein